MNDKTQSGIRKLKMKINETLISGTGIKRLTGNLEWGKSKCLL